MLPRACCCSCCQSASGNLEASGTSLTKRGSQQRRSHWKSLLEGRVWPDWLKTLILFPVSFRPKIMITPNCLLDHRSSAESGLHGVAAVLSYACGTLGIWEEHQQTIRCHGVVFDRHEKTVFAVGDGFRAATHARDHCRHTASHC